VTLSSQDCALPAVHGRHVGEAGLGRRHETSGDRVRLVFATLIALALPLQLPHVYSISLGAPLVLFLAPIIVPTVTQRLHSRWFAVGALIPILTAPIVILVALTTDPFRNFSGPTALASIVLILALAIQVFGIAWASSVLGLARTTLLYSLAATLNVTINPQLWLTNPWKYAFAWPLSLLLISVLARAPQILRILIISLASLYALFHESRNSAGVLLLTLVITSLMYAANRKTRKRRRVVAVCLLGIGALGIYSLVIQMAADGHLGQDLQRIQMSQSSSQSPIAGRIEYGATFALMRANPMGFGPGVLPSGNDVALGKSGLSAIGANTSGEYVDGVMFADAFEMHSVTGDLWLRFGIPGLILAMLILVSLARATLISYGSRLTGETAVCFFLMFQALWDLFFSPLTSTFRSVGFAAGIALWVIARQAIPKQPGPGEYAVPRCGKHYNGSSALLLGDRPAHSAARNRFVRFERARNRGQ